MAENSKQMFALLISFQMETMNGFKCWVAVTTLVTTSFFYVFHYNAHRILQEILYAFKTIRTKLSDAEFWFLSLKYLQHSMQHKYYVSLDYCVVVGAKIWTIRVKNLLEPHFKWTNAMHTLRSVKSKCGNGNILVMLAWNE